MHNVKHYSEDDQLLGGHEHGASGLIENCICSLDLDVVHTPGRRNPSPSVCRACTHTETTRCYASVSSDLRQRRTAIGGPLWRSEIAIQRF